MPRKRHGTMYHGAMKQCGLRLQVPLTTINACSQLEIGQELQLHGTATCKKPDYGSEEVQLCVQKMAKHICFVLQSSSVSEKIEHLLRDSWCCVVAESSDTVVSTSVPVTSGGALETTMVPGTAGGALDTTMVPDSVTVESLTPIRRSARKRCKKVPYSEYTPTKKMKTDLRSQDQDGIGCYETENDTCTSTVKTDIHRRRKDMDSPKKNVNTGDRGSDLGRANICHRSCDTGTGNIIHQEHTGNPNLADVSLGDTGSNIRPGDCNISPGECNISPGECNISPGECNISPVVQCNITPEKGDANQRQSDNGHKEFKPALCSDHADGPVQEQNAPAEEQCGPVKVNEHQGDQEVSFSCAVSLQSDIKMEQFHECLMSLTTTCELEKEGHNLTDSSVAEVRSEPNLALDCSVMNSIEPTTCDTNIKHTICDTDIDREIPKDEIQKEVLSNVAIKDCTSNISVDEKAFACHFCSKEFQLCKKPLMSLQLHETQCLKNRAVVKNVANSRKRGSSVQRKRVQHQVQCDICLESFSSLTLLLAHMKDVHEEKMLKQDTDPCQFCGQFYGSESDKDVHENACSSNPNKIESHTCNICHQPFHTEQKLKVHVVKKHQRRKTKDVSRECDKCGLMFRKDNTFYVHRITAHNARPAKFHCPHCSKKFHFKDAYNMHLATHSEARPCLCSICGKCFKNRDQLKKHRKRLHEDQWPYRCEKCGHGVDMKKHLLTHQCSRVRRNPDGSHKPNKYPKKKKVVNHRPVKCVAKVPAVPWVSCSICGKKRKNNYTLLKHLTDKHREDVMFEQEADKLRELLKVKCELCEKSFACSKTLMEHRRNTHQAEEHSTCEECHKSYSTPMRLKEHIRNVHGNIHYSCDQCESVFKSRRNLVWHVRYQHTEHDRKYKCDSCDFRYAFNKQLYEHKTRVHGPKNEECPHCGYRCATRWYMKKHSRSCSGSYPRKKYYHQSGPVPHDDASHVTYVSMDEAAVTVEIPADTQLANSELEEVSEALIQLESGEVIIEQPVPMEAKQLQAQLTSCLTHNAGTMGENPNLFADKPGLLGDNPRSLCDNIGDNPSSLCDNIGDNPRSVEREEVIIRPQDDNVVVELPESWNERSLPDNFASIESIMGAVAEHRVTQQESDEKNIQEYHVTQSDGSEHIVQLIYQE